MLTQEEWRRRDLVGLAELAASGAVTRQEIMLTAIREIERLNPVLNAVVEPDFEHVLAHMPSGPDAGRFAGMPYLIKDLHAPVQRLPLANGSVRFKGTSFDFDSTTVSRLRNAGFGFLGRTTAPEFGLSLATESAAWGITRNPWNPEHGAGGSSGGAGAAVASGMVPAAHATDSAGSIRIPAAFNGLVGFKPTRGVNAFGPHRGDPNLGMSHEHALTHTVRDTAALLDITAGPDVGAPYFTTQPEQPFEALVATAPVRLRIGFVATRFDSRPVHPESVTAVHNTAAILSQLGHDVEEASPDFDSNLLTDTMIRFLIGSLAGMFPAEAGAAEDLEGLEPMTQAVVRMAQDTSLEAHLVRGATINSEVRRLARFFEQFDLLLTPTTNGPAPEHGVLSTSGSDVDGFLEKLWEIAPFTAAFNASGQPAISLPMHMSAAQLPVGIQLVGQFGEDATVLKVAAQLEEASDWNGDDRRSHLQVM